MTGTAEILRFGEFELDPARAELRRAGAAVAIEPQVLDLIAFLAARAGQLCSRDDLIDGIWHGRIVSDSAISSRINAARVALGDDGKAQAVIRTVPRRGFVFVAAVETASAPPAQAGPPLPAKPSIAVLPFDNLSSDPEQEFFADGMTDDIITELSRYEELFVIGRQSAFAFRGRDRDVAKVARELGVRYLLEGSVRRAGTKLRVSVQLVDAKTQSSIWADRFDREMEDIFAVQDEITGVIVNTLAGAVHRQQFRRTERMGPAAVDAYDLMARAFVLFWRLGRESNLAARAAAEQAIAIDPNLARAHALIALTHIAVGTNRWTHDVSHELDRSRDAAFAAVAADEQEPWAHLSLANSYLYRDAAHENCLTAHSRALALNPSNAHFHAWRGVALVYDARPAEAVQEIEYAMRLNPIHPPLYEVFMARALFSLGEYERTRPIVQRIMVETPEHTQAVAVAAACYMAMGLKAEAADAVRAILRNAPDATVSALGQQMPYRLAQDRDRLLDMLAKAGLPDA